MVEKLHASVRMMNSEKKRFLEKIPADPHAYGQLIIGMYKGTSESSLFPFMQFFDKHGGKAKSGDDLKDNVSSDMAKYIFRLFEIWEEIRSKYCKYWMSPAAAQVLQEDMPETLKIVKEACGLQDIKKNAIKKARAKYAAAFDKAPEPRISPGGDLL